ncbi:MAG: MBL fold metallo-hydrolase [Rhodospirillaceae bacterium]|jgi:L-ascorbate metabolism protein UlaG (beta-lactamase superfamily)
MRAYLRTRMVNAGVDKKKAKKLVKRLRPGGKMKFGGVTVATIATEHANGANAPFVIDKDLAKSLKKSGLTVYVGPDSGFILKFSNGLTVYLSADTGHISDMDTIVRRYYKANLAVMNIGDVNTMGPEEAAWATKKLIKPAAVIPSHANEQSTKGGKVIAGTKLEKFIKHMGGAMPVHIPLTERTMEFDGSGKCVKGC